MNTVLIGCKLPHGLVVKGTGGQDIKLNGMNTSLVAGGFGLTHVEEGEAAFVFATYDEHAAFKSKSIFSAGTDTVADIRDMGIDLSELKTGFEGMDPEKPAPGLKAENPDELKKAIETAPHRPAAAPKTKADKAAANALAGKK